VKLSGNTLVAYVLPERLRKELGIARPWPPWQLTRTQLAMLKLELGLPIDEEPALPAEPTTDLFPHQKDAIAWLHDRQGRGMLAMEMGCGKTRTVIEYLCDRLERVLVLCPLSVAYSWRTELQKWAPGTTPSLIVGSTAQKLAALAGPGPWITNYEAVRSAPVLRALLSKVPGALVLDESTKIKNRTALVSRAVIGLAERVNGPVIPMSGKPTPESPLDIWSQVRTFEREPLGFKTWYAMRGRYAQPGGYMGREIVGYRDEADFLRRFREVAFRVTKAEVLKDLPPKIYEVRHVTLEGRERSAYEQMKRDCLVQLGKRELDAPNVLAQMLRLQQITSGWAAPKGKGAKIEALAEILDEAPKPVVVWSRFTEDLDRILDLARREKLRGGRLDGSVTGVKRGAVLDDFAAGKIDVLAANPAAGGMGVQLQRASVQVYYAPSFSHEQRAQSEDRLHRMGQESPVTIIDLVASKTVDETVLKALELKSNLSALVLGDLASVFGEGAKDKG